MQDLWRLSAADLAALVKSKKISAKEAATDALARLDAVNPKINAVVDHRPDDVLKQAAEVDAKIARGEDAGILAGVPVTVKVNIDQQGFATTNGLKLQRDAIAPANSPGHRQSEESRRRHSRPHQLPGLLLSLVHQQSHSRRHQKSARPVDHARRLVGRRGRGGRGRHRPDRAWHRYRGLDPLPRLCLRRARLAADARPCRRLSIRACRSAPSGRRSRRCPARSRAPSRICGSRSPRCRRAIRAIPGGCRRRWRVRQCRSAPRSVSTRTDSIPCPK